MKRCIFRFLRDVARDENHPARSVDPVCISCVLAATDEQDSSGDLTAKIHRIIGKLHKKTTTLSWEARCVGFVVCKSWMDELKISPTTGRATEALNTTEKNTNDFDKENRPCTI